MKSGRKGSSTTRRGLRLERAAGDVDLAAPAAPAAGKKPRRKAPVDYRAVEELQRAQRTAKVGVAVANTIAAATIAATPPKKGRPPALEISAKILREIETLAGVGLDQKEIAAALGISHDTLTRRKQDSSEVEDAIARGKARAGAAVGKALYRVALRGDVAAIRWYETTRQGRTDKVAVTTRDATLEDLVRRLAAEDDAAPPSDDADDR